MNAIQQMIADTINTYPQTLYITGNYNVSNVDPYKQLVFYNDKNKAAFASLDSCGNQDIFTSTYDSSGNATAVRVGGNANDYAVTSVLDASNNLYSCGYYKSGGFNVFNVNNSIFNSLNSSAGNVQQIYLIKYDNSLNPLWSTRIVGTDNVVPLKIIIDKKNNVIMAAYYYSNPVTIYDVCGNSVSLTNDTTTSNPNSFVVKYNTNGALLWARKIGGTGNSNTVPSCINSDTANNIYVCVTTATSVLKIYNTNNTTVFASFNLPANCPACAGIIKYNESGTPIIAIYIGAPLCSIYNIAIDNSNNPFFIGIFEGDLGTPLNVYDSNNGTNSVGTINNENFLESLILKYDNNNTFKWVTSLTGGRNDTISYYSLDNYGNLYISGIFRSQTLTVYNSDKTSFKTLSNGTGLDNQAYNTFIAKYNKDGSGQWATRIGGTGGQIPKNMVLGSDNNIYLLGSYTSKPVTIYNTNDSSYVSFDNSGTSTNDIFIVKYGSSGAISWATHLGSNGDENSSYMNLDSANNVYIYTNYANTLWIYDKNNNTTTTRNLTFTSTSTNSDLGIIKYDKDGNYKWSSRIGGLGIKQTFDMKIDALNNIYISGYYCGLNPLTFYSSSNTAFMDLSSNSSTITDIFLAKYDSNGNGIYGRRIGNTNQLGNSIVNFYLSNPIPLPIKTKNVYITGYYYAALTLYNADNSTLKTLTNDGTNDIFIAKYDTSGIGQWATRISSTVSDTVFEMILDSDNKMYVYGRTNNGNVTLYNADNSQFKTITSPGYAIGYTVKYDTNGTIQWVAVVGRVTLQSMTLDSSKNVYISAGIGNISQPSSLYNADDSTFISPLSSVSTSGDTVLIKYNSNGMGQWKSRIVNGFSVNMAVDSSKNVYICGIFNSNGLILYNQDDSQFKSISGSTGIFIAKYDINGIGQWGAYITYASLPNVIQKLLLDSNNNVYIYGDYDSSITFYNQDNSASNGLSSNGSTDAFIAKYNSNGECQWATRIGGTGIDTTTTTLLDSANNIYIYGRCGSSSLIFYNADTSQFKTLPFGSLFLAKYNTNGMCQWATRIGTTSRSVNMILDSANNVYISAYYTASVTFYNSDNSQFKILSLTGAVNYNTFIAKYDTNGFCKWVSGQLQSTSDSGVVSTIFMSSDSLKNVYISSRLNVSNITFYNADDSIFKTLTNIGNYDVFVSKYNTNGVCEWATLCGGTGQDAPVKLIVQ